MVRGQRVPVDLVEQAIDVVLAGESVPVVADRLGISAKTIWRYMAFRKQATKSTKLGVLRAIASGARDVATVQREVGLERHSLVHLIYSLQKQGWVTFILRKGVPVNLDITVTGLTALNARLNGAAQQAPEPARTDEEPVDVPDPSETTEADPEPEVVRLPVAVEIEPATSEPSHSPDGEWPILDRLITRHAALSGALSSLQGVPGLEEVTELIQDQLDALSDVEQEYVTFARAHGHG